MNQQAKSRDPQIDQKLTGSTQNQQVKTRDQQVKATHQQEQRQAGKDEGGAQWRSRKAR